MHYQLTKYYFQEKIMPLCKATNEFIEWQL